MLTPTIIATAEVEEITLLIMEAAATVGRGALQWRQMGRSLARLHSVKGESFGSQHTAPTTTWRASKRGFQLQRGALSAAERAGFERKPACAGRGAARNSRLPP